MSTHIPSSQTTEDDSFRTVINEYQGFLFHQAMAPSNIESCLRRSRHFLIWLSRNGLGLSEVDGEVAARFQTHDCTCFGRSCARSKLGPARTAAGSSSSRVMWFVRFLELSGRTPTPGELEDNLARVPAFLHELRRQGYTQSRVDRFRYGATAFIAWLHLSRMRLRDIDADTLERFHHRRFACSIPGICWGRRSENERRYGPDIRRFLDHLADTGQIEPWRRALGTHRECFAGFRAWLARTRDISAGGINDYIKQLQAVLPALGEVPESYDAALIRRVMLAHLERGSRSRARVLAMSLRMYLRFLAFEGHVPAALVGAVPSVPAWSLSTLPRHIPVEDVERTIESCDTATPAGTRDRAALLLLARLALRAGDVVALRLTDIDWDRALLRVNGKTRRDTLLPLPQDVGDALHAYIASARPRIDEPRVFLAVNAPFRPISGSGVVSAIARRAFERAGVVPPATRGAHTMRHSAATGWLRAGMPMEAIRVLLRHRSSSTTAIYAKTDTTMLDAVAQPWSGGPVQ